MFQIIGIPSVEPPPPIMTLMSSSMTITMSTSTTSGIYYFCPTLPSKSHEYHYVVHLG